MHMPGRNLQVRRGKGGNAARLVLINSGGGGTWAQKQVLVSTRKGDALQPRRLFKKKMSIGGKKR